MSAPRHRSRLTRATIVDAVRDGLTASGWMAPPLNFGIPEPVKLVDYQPDEHMAAVTTNTVAVSLGDIDETLELELGAGLVSMFIPVFIDVYGSQQAISEALCDDIRDALEWKIMPLLDFTTVTPTEIPGVELEVMTLTGPRRPSVTVTLDGLKRYWRVLGLDCQLRWLR